MKDIKSSTESTKGAKIRGAVRDRYGKIAVGEGTECCGPSCCTPSGATEVARDIGYSGDDLDAVPENANLGLGCGNPVALASLMPGEVVLDLGAGGGLDCFLAAQAVGDGGSVIGVDMTPEMVELARENATKGGYSNVDFRLGQIEALPVADNSVDVILSNCVINLSPEPERVFSEAFRVLKPGGRLMLSDLVSDLPVPDVLLSSMGAIVSCLPVPREKYLGRMADAGFVDIEVNDEHSFKTDHLSQDSAIGKAIAASGPLRGTIDRFAAKITSARISATKPVAAEA